jgi:hypothetical protein
LILEQGRLLSANRCLGFDELSLSTKKRVEGDELRDKGAQLSSAAEVR